MAVMVAAQASGTPRPGAGAAAPAQGLSAPQGASPAAQALAPKKASRFLQLFRKLAAGVQAARPEAAREQGAAAPSAMGAARRKDGSPFAGSPAGELRAEVVRARPASARRARRAPSGEGEGPGAEASAAPPAAALTAPRRSEGAAAVPPPAEARREQRPAQVKVVVLDLRARPVEAEKTAETRRASAPPAPEGPLRSFERVLLAREPGPVEQGLPGPRTADSTALPGPLRERLVPEIVHQAGIILRDGGEGEIRLVLKPEHLGSVRIRLQLGESSLEGRIVVDNSNVKELLDSHLEQLKSALRQEGWASANINVTVSGGGGERRGLTPGPEPLPAVSGRTVGEFERATPAMLDLGFTTVNLLA